MAKPKYADIEIVTPGTFAQSTIIINGMDMSRFITNFEMKMDPNENRIAIVKIGFIANVRITGKAIIDVDNGTD